MAEIYDLNTNASGNNSQPPEGFPENMQYSQVNNAAREQMAVLARYIQALGAITTTGSGNSYTLTLAQALTGGVLSNGMHFIFKADKTNTGAATLQINAGAAVPLRDVSGNPLSAGEITVSGIYFVVYDGSGFRIVGGESAAVIKTKYESNANTNAFTDTLLSKLNGIESGATADQTPAEIRAAVEAATDSNVFTDTLLSKLNGVESGATADQTPAEIRAAVEAATDSNVFTDSDHTKLDAFSLAGSNISTSNRVRINNSGDLSLAGDLHGFQVGLTSGGNIGIDGNEIQARNNGASAALNIQADGGPLELGLNAPINLNVRTGGQFRLYEADNTSYLRMTHDANSTDLTLIGTPGPHTLNLGQGYNQIDLSGTTFRIRDGASLVLFDASDSNSVAINHTGPDFRYSFTNTTDWEVLGLSGEVDFNTIPIRTRRGINGSYDVDAPASSDWAAPVWSLSSSFNGSGDSGSGWVSTGHFGMHWARTLHSAAVSEIGEGAYFRVNGVLHGGFGTAGGFVNGELNVWRDTGPQLVLRDSDNTGNAMTNWLRFEDSAGSRHGYLGFADAASENFDVFNDNGIVRIGSNNVIEAQTQDSNAGGNSSGLQARDHAQTFRDVGWNTIPVYEIDANDTFDVDHMSQMWHKDAGGAATFTCASTSDIPNGATFMVANEDAENLTIAQGGGVALRWFNGSGSTPPTGNRTVAQAGYAVVYKYTDSQYWVLGGVGVS